MPSPARLQRRFLPWDRPWLPQVAEALAAGWQGAGPLDLSDTLAIVPTSEAGRRLREALAEHAARRDAAVFAPRTQTPDTMLAEGTGEPGVATRFETLLAWAHVLREVDLARMRDVFPLDPPRRDFAWAWRLAENFFRLQTQLTENGLAFADVPRLAGAEFSEAARWQQLAELEQLLGDRLAAAGRQEPHAARRAFARAPKQPEGIRRIVVLAVPDPLPLAVRVLERWAESVPVDVVVCAPEAEAAAFDSVGRPLPEAWTNRVLTLASFEDHVHLCADAPAEAAHAAAIAGGYEQPEGIVAFGIADPEVLPLLANELSRRGIASFNPEGNLRREEGLYALLATLAAFAGETNFEQVAALLRCPDVLGCLRAKGGDFSAARLLARLDDLRARHLPADLAALRFVALSERKPVIGSGAGQGTREILDPNSGAGRPEASENPADRLLVRAVELLDQLHAILTHGTFPENAAEAVSLLFADRRFDLSDPEDQRLAEAAAAWREVLRQCAAARASFGELALREWWEVALRTFGEGRSPGDQTAAALDLQGWLELLWEDAPHLVVAGMNDGLVPDAVVGDAFLPEGLRQRLGLKSNRARFTRDLYLLEALVARRRHAGRIDLLFAKVSGVGEPMRPSRLLLRCPEPELPPRTAFLFRAAPAARANLPWTRAWELDVRREPAPASVPVTSLRTWLQCPFRFYLRHVLRMEPVDAAKCELDARDFGTLCHTALERMALDPAMRVATDETRLRDFLLGEFEREVRRRFGRSLSLPLVVQLESARQRLGKVAALQARERAAGWVIERVETPFSLVIHGLEVRGKIDRIDRHERSGAVRVLDYKTGDVAKSPHSAHLRKVWGAAVDIPAWRRVMLGSEHTWTDLQLPLYHRAVAAQGIGGEITCGYINMPKAVGETSLALWPELTPELLASAQACTDEVAAAIRRSEFWPPAAAAPPWDPFEALFHQGAEASVRWAAAAPEGAHP